MNWVCIFLVLAGMLAGTTFPGFAQQDIRVATWNVFLTPSIAHASMQVKRVPHIYEAVKTLNADIMVLEEMFHGRAARKLEAKLDSIYPYKTTKTKAGFFKVHSGVRVFSKFPIDSFKVCIYRDAVGSDKLARKAGVLCFINVNGKKIQVLGTHLQSGDAEKQRKARKMQMAQLTRELLDPYLQPGVPQVLAGDMNVDMFNITEYLEMRDLFFTKEFMMEGDYRFSWNGQENAWGSRFFGTNVAMLDYILMRDYEGGASLVWEQILRPQITPPLKNKYKDMSDHYPVLAKIRLQ